MMIVDACVWIASLDAADLFSGESRRFLQAVSAKAEPLCIPSFALVETGCAVARRRRNSAQGRAVAACIQAMPSLQILDVDQVLLDWALQDGTQGFLRGADAIYVAAARLTSSVLITWDDELLKRANGMTPTDRLAANP